MLKFYHSKNVNFVTWNYRGCNLSQGLPTLGKIKCDAIVVAEYIKNRIGKQAKIIAHGTSMGGAAAAHIARRNLCDFLICDRTFGSLSEVPKLSLGSWSATGLKFLFEWDTDSVKDYYYANCYKVIAQDPHDEIINDPSSLKSMLSTNIVHREINNMLL